jgi:hypothetical protein
VHQAAGAHLLADLEFGPTHDAQPERCRLDAGRTVVARDAPADPHLYDAAPLAQRESARIAARQVLNIRVPL